MTDDAREAILSRIKKSLEAPSPRPHWQDEPVGTGPIFPLPDARDETAVQRRFREEFEAVQGEWHTADSVEEAQGWLADWTKRETLTPILAPRHPLVEAALAGRADVHWIEPGASTKGWEAFPLGVTACESLVAESGSILVSAKLSGRASSVLPPTHLVVATADQLVPDIETSMRRLRDRYGEEFPSTMSWITGPSRTADIEKILVLGAHGPRRLAILVLPTDTLTT